MRKLIFLFIFLFAVKNSWADVSTEKYAVKKPDGSVVVVLYEPSSRDSLTDVLRSAGLSQYPVIGIKESDYKSDRSDRDFWTMQGRSIVTDEVKKQEAEEIETAKKEEKQAVLDKLKITQEEAVILKEVSHGK